MKARQVRALVAALAAATTVAGTAVPALADDNPVKTESGTTTPSSGESTQPTGSDVSKEQKDSTTTPSGKDDPSTEKKEEDPNQQTDPEKKDETKPDGKTLVDGDTVTVTVKEETVKGSEAVAGTATVIKESANEKLTEKDVTVDSTKVADGKYLFYEGNWYKTEDGNTIAKNDGKNVDPVTDGISVTKGKVPTNNDVIEVTKTTEKEASVEKYTPATENSASKLTGDYFSVANTVEAGDYIYKTKTENDTTTGAWYKSSDVNDGNVTENASAVDGIKLVEKESRTETDKLADGDTIHVKVEDKITGNTVKYTSQAGGSKLSDGKILVNPEAADGKYVYAGASGSSVGAWYKESDVNEDGTVKENAQKVTTFNPERTASNGDTIEITGHKDAGEDTTKNVASVSDSNTKNKINNDKFVLPEDIKAGTYIYNATTGKWSTKDGNENLVITVKEDAKPSTGGNTSGGGSGSTGGSTGGSSSSGSGSSSSSGSGSSSTSGGSTGGSSSSSSNGGSSAGNTSGNNNGNSNGNSNTGNNNGASNNNNGSNNGGTSDNGSQNSGKTSDQVAVDTSKDSTTGLDTAEGTEVNGIYQTSDGVILVNQAVDTGDGIVITDASGKAVAPNSKIKYEGKTRLINDDGYLAINEKVTVKGKTFVAKKDGTAAKKAFVTLRTTGSRVYTNGKGAIVKNKAFKVKGKAYVAKKSGALVKNGTITIKGKKYTVKNYKVVKTVKVKKAKKARK